jgi:phytol kinase
MTVLAISLGKIGVSLALMALLLCVVSRLVRHGNLSAEIARKSIHVSLGLYCLTFPWLFMHAWEVALACAGAIALFLFARFRLRASLGAGLYAVERRSFGEFYFTLAVLYLFIARETHAPNSAIPADLIYVAPLLVLTIGDTAAALIGVHFGRLRFTIGGGSKSLEGVCAFFVAAWLCSFAALACLTQMSVPDALRLSAAAAAAGAAFEAISWRGFDNLTAPLGAYAVFAYAAPGAQFSLPTQLLFAFPP